MQALGAAFEAARQETERPSFISLRTIIGWPAPNLQNTGKAHGSALGDDEVAATKKLLGFDPGKTFDVDPRGARARPQGRRARPRGPRRVERDVRRPGPRPTASGKALLDRMQDRRLPDGWTEALPQFPADEKGMATRKASGEVLTAIVPVLPELWGGSADLAESNNTTPKGEPSFLPEDRQSKMFQGGPYGRMLHFGIREHAMGSILNGIALHGGTRPYGGTFLVFSDYMRPAVRLAAIMQLPVTYVWTHDSIGLGEDGPTHQPVEHLAALRAIPGLDVVRPADANETAVAWRTILEHTDRPAGALPDPPGRPDVGPVGLRAGRGHQVRRLHPGRRLRRPAAGRADRHRLGGAARGRRPRDARGRGHADPRGLDAVRRVVQPAGRGLPAAGAPERGEGPGQRRGRGQPGLARDRR